MSVAASMKYLQSRPKDELKAIYSSLHGVVPGVVGVNDNDRLSRPQLIEMILGVRNIRPRHLSTIHQRTPFAIRDYLRRQAKREGLEHIMNKPWKLSGLEYAVLFSHRITRGMRAEGVNDNGAPNGEAMREALENATSNDNGRDDAIAPEPDQGEEVPADEDGHQPAEAV